MEELGADTVLVCSNVSPHAIDDDALAAAQLRELAERAARARDPDRLRGARVGAPRARLRPRVADRRGAATTPASAPASTRSTSSRAAPTRAGIRDIPAEKIFFLQLADAPELVMDVLQWSRHYRCFPGQGGFDLAGFLGHVLAAGYDGPLSLEVFNDVFRQADPGRMAVDAMRSLLLLEDELPPAAALRGYAFAELAVAPERAAGLERLLIAMGFRHAGQHRSKPVQLWRHGETRVLVNHEPPCDEPRIAAIAVESADPIRSAERAEALLAPSLPRDRAPGEADLHLGRRARRHRRCSSAAPTTGRRDFLTAGAPGAGRRAAPAIDHVALSQPFDFFDEAALFYRSVLGLELEAGAGARRARTGWSAAAPRATPTAACASRSASRWSAAAAPSSSTWRSRRDDVFAAAEAMRERGVPLLADPRQLLRRPRGAHGPRAGRDRADARARRALRGGRARRAAALLHRDGERRACSSRCSSAAAATTATAPSNSPVRMAAQAQGLEASNCSGGSPGRAAPAAVLRRRRRGAALRARGRAPAHVPVAAVARDPGAGARARASSSSPAPRAASS